MNMRQLGRPPGQESCKGARLVPDLRVVADWVLMKRANARVLARPSQMECRIGQ